MFLVITFLSDRRQFELLNTWYTLGISYLFKWPVRRGDNSLTNGYRFSADKWHHSMTEQLTISARTIYVLTTLFV